MSPIAPLSVCASPGCPVRVPRGYCSAHARTSPRNHRGVPASRRGYDAAYRKVRLTFIGQLCSFCGTALTPANVSADHYARGLRPACQSCNFADGARRRGYITGRAS